MVNACSSCGLLCADGGQIASAVSTPGDLLGLVMVLVDEVRLMVVVLLESPMVCAMLQCRPAVCK